MSEEKLFKNYYQLIKATENCIDQNLVLPSLILIYTSIDSVSWIANDSPNADVGKQFQKWVNEWMLKDGGLDCTAEELYAARCGVLHTLTPNSRLSEKKGVRKVAYAWGKASPDKLTESISALSMRNSLASVHIEDLFWSFRNSFANYMDHVFNDNEERAKFLNKAGEHFTNLEMAKMDDFLAITRKTKA
ncbi:MAG: hypothetical protein WC685_14530 [Methylobacter sp.]|jgi:hypothetical protein